MQNEEDTFQQFEDEFRSLTNGLARKLETLNNTKDAPTISAVTQEAEADILDAKTSLANIERELRNWGYSAKSKAQARLRTLRRDFENQQTQLKEAAASSDSAMPAGLSKADQKRWKEQRRRLLGTKATVDSTSVALDRTAQQLAETAEIGQNTTMTLQQQREQMIRARETIRETDSLLVKSRKTLRRMSRRVVTNKLIQGLIILLELGIIVLIIYFHCYRDKK